MPLYEYECVKNGHRFELIRQFSDPPLTRCIKCKSKVRKLISASQIAFKGTGWYVSDYAGKTGSSTNGKGKPPSSDSDSAPKTESKDSGSGRPEPKKSGKD